MSSGGGTNTTTSTSAPPAAFLNAYTAANQNASQVASVPFQNYTGNLAAPLAPDQVAGIQETENAQGIANPYINAGAQYINAATTPIWGETAQFSPSNVSQFESPFTQQVLGTTEAAEANTDAQQLQQVKGNAASQGALGGDREAVAQGITAGQQAIANNATNAGIENQGYSQALGEFNTQQQAQLGANEANSWLNSQAGYGIANLGQEAESTALGGASALQGIGSLEQAQAQQELNVPYEQFTAAEAYPFQTAGWQANIAEGLGSAAGGTGTTSQTPSTASQLLGLGTAGIGAAGLANQAGLFGSSATGVDPSVAALAAESAAAGTADSSAGLLAAANSGLGAVYHRGGGVDARAPGGIVPSTPPGGSAPPVSGAAPIPTGDPNVSVSVVPEGGGGGKLGGLFGAPIDASTTTVSKSGGPSGIASLFEDAGQIAAGIYGGPAGAAAAGAASQVVNNARRGGAIRRDDGGSVPNTDLTDIIGLNAINTLDAAMARGGIVVMFPRPHGPRTGIAANDHWKPHQEPKRAAGGIAAGLSPTSNPAVSTFVGNHGIAVPQLTTTPTTARNTGPGINVSTGQGTSNTGSPALDQYLNSVETGTSYAAPKGFVPPPPPTPPAAAAAPSAAAAQAAAWQAQAAMMNPLAPPGSSGGGNARGGIVRRAWGGTFGDGPDADPGEGIDMPGGPPPVGSGVPITPSVDFPEGIQDGDGGGESGGIAPPNVTVRPRGAGSPTPPPTAARVGPPPRGTDSNADADSGVHAPVGASPWKALLYAGLGMMGGGHGSAAENIGQGALAGLKEFTSEDEAAKRLSTAAEEARARLKETQAWHEATAGNQANRNETYAGLVAAHADEYAAQVAKLNAAAGNNGERFTWNKEVTQDGRPILVGNRGTMRVGDIPGGGSVGLNPTEQSQSQRRSDQSSQGWAHQAQLQKQQDALTAYRNASEADRNHYRDLALQAGNTLSDIKMTDAMGRNQVTGKPLATPQEGHNARVDLSRQNAPPVPAPPSAGPTAQPPAVPLPDPLGIR